ncbi:MAG: AMP-binding protein [Exilibacterium sp.]
MIADRYPHNLALVVKHQSIKWGYRTFQQRVEQLAPDDKLCIHHCFGMVLGTLACISRGACAVFSGSSFDPLQTLSSVESEGCTALHGVPTMFIAELEHPDFGDFDLSTLRTGIMAGSSCPVEVMKRMQIAHFKIPHYIEIVDQFPMTVTGKIQKFKMREVQMKAVKANEFGLD